MLKTFRERAQKAIANSRELKEAEKIWSDAYLDHLRELYPEGRVEGNHYRVNSDGGSGRKIAFELDKGTWTDFGVDDIRGKGLFNFVYFLEGWDGIRRLTQQEFCNINIPLYLNHSTIKGELITHHATKKGLEVTRRWDYNDSDGTILGVRARLEDPSTREKEFITLTYRSAWKHEKAGKTIYRSEGWNVIGSWGPIAPFYGEELLEPDSRPILICEGEKATDAARKFLSGSYRCITWGGGSSKSIANASWDILEKQEKIYWPDKDIPGRKSAEKLSEDVKDLKVVPVFAETRLKEADDLADIEEPDGQKWIWDLIGSAARLSNGASASQAERYVYVIKQDAFFDRDTYDLKTWQQVTRTHMHEANKLGDELLEDSAFKRVESMTFKPGGDYFVMERINGADIECLNRWKPNDLAKEGGEPEMFLEHVNYLIPDKEIREHILDYLAFYVQKPGEKVHSSIVLQGAQGTGKSYILEVLKRIIGSHLVREITTDMLKRDFNSWMEDAQIIAVEEIMAGGKMEITNKLKPLITSPTVSINNKGAKEYTIPNRGNFIFFTNHEFSLHLDDGDRRFMVYFSPVKPKTDENYYLTLFEDLEENSGKILNFLMKRDISAFNPKAPARMTEAKQSIIDRSKSSLEVEIQERINEKITPFDMDVVSIMDITDWARGARLINQFQTSMIVAAALKKVGAVDLGAREVNKEMRRVWSVRNHHNHGVGTEPVTKHVRDINSGVDTSIDPEDDAGKV